VASFDRINRIDILDLGLGIQYTAALFPNRDIGIAAQIDLFSYSPSELPHQRSSWRRGD
jgi:hypothetical protein